MRRHRRVVLAVLGIVLAATATITPSAQAEVRKGTLTFTPGSGLDTTRIQLHTDQSCPAETAFGYAVAYGKGFPKEGQTVVSSSLNTLSRTAPFAVKMQDTMAGFAAINGSALGGPYTVTFYCVDDTNTIRYAEFTGVVTFVTPKTWTAPVYTAPSAGASPVGSSSPTAGPDGSSSPTAGSSGSPAASGGSGSQNPTAGSTTSPGSSASPNASGSGSPGPSAGSGDSAAQSPAPGSSGSESSSTFRWIASIAGIALVLFGVALWWTGRRRDLAPVTDDAVDPSADGAGTDEDAS